MVSYNNAYWSLCGESHIANDVGLAGPVTEAVVDGFTECVAELTAANFAAPDAGNPPVIGEIMRFSYSRSGEAVADTIADEVAFVGFKLTYKAKS